jgi:hypothetical protein
VVDEQTVGKPITTGTEEHLAIAVERMRSRVGAVTAVLTFDIDLRRLIGRYVGRIEYDDFLDHLYLAIDDPDLRAPSVILCVPVDHRVNTILWQALEGGGIYVASPRPADVDLVRLAIVDSVYGCYQSLHRILIEHRERLVRQVHAPTFVMT